MRISDRGLGNMAYIVIMVLSLAATFFSSNTKKSIEESLVIFVTLLLHKYWRQIFAQYKNAQGARKYIFNYKNAEKYFFFDVLLCLLSTVYFVKGLTGSGWSAIIDILIFAVLNSFLVFHLMKRHCSRR